MAAQTQVETRVSAGRLEGFVRDLFRAAGVPGDDAETIAAAVVGQEIRGLTTHGLRMVDWNLKGLAEGRIRATPDQAVLSDHGITAVIEGDHGVGMVGCMKAMRLAIAKAREGGIGIALVVRNNHFLAATPYCLEAAKGGNGGDRLLQHQARHGLSRGPGKSDRQQSPRLRHPHGGGVTHSLQGPSRAANLE